METVSVRYIVDEVELAVAFYTTHLQFGVVVHPGPGFAMLERGNLRLLLNKPGGGGGAGQSMPDGQSPEPGGWNRVQLPVENLAQEVDRLQQAGCRFRNEIVVGNGGKQILLEDPSGNLVELFEPVPRR
jgi:catechol 2,3-dioxygenase-like lactoylglutathione lyase family enzyme